MCRRKVERKNRKGKMLKKMSSGIISKEKMWKRKNFEKLILKGKYVEFGEYQKSDVYSKL